LTTFTMGPAGLASSRGSGARAVREAFGDLTRIMEEVGGSDCSPDRMFRPGLPRAEVIDTLVAAGVQPRDEIVEYWTLQNGVFDPPAPPPPPTCVPLGLDVALELRRRRTSSWDPIRSSADEAWMNPDWLELAARGIVADTTGDLLGACLVQRVDTQVQQILERSDTEHQLVSVATLFDQLTEAIRAGVFKAQTEAGRVIGWTVSESVAEFRAIDHGTWVAL
jgi:hypothetical protein